MKNQLEQLITVYEKALETQPENALVHSQVAKLYYAQGKLDAAMAACRMALQIQPDLVTSQELLHELLLAQNKINEPNLSNWLTVEAENLINHPDVINQIYKGEIEGLLIKNVFSKEEMNQVKYKLESKKSAIKPTFFGLRFGLWVLDLEKDSREFLKKVDIYRAELKDIFETDFAVKIKSILEGISGSKSVQLPRINNEEIYIPGNFKILLPYKLGIKAHTETETFKGFRISSFLDQIPENPDILSYYITIDRPEKGGELIVYDLSIEERIPDIKSYNTPEKAEENSQLAKRDLYLERFKKKYITPDIGDMIVFNSGVRWHKISDVEGQKNRITIGGFIVKSKDEQKLIYFE